MQLVARGDGHAQRLLANRLVVRVRRAATAIMRGSVDADDAAQHELAPSEAPEGDRLLAARRDMRKLIQRDRAIGASKGGKP